MRGEKARWKLSKNAVSCFEQIQEEAHYKVAAVWLLIPISHTTLVRWARHGGLGK